MINEYYTGEDVISADNGSSNYSRISPSSIADFFSHPRQWWGTNFLNEPGFTGNTNSTLGTIIHYFAALAGLKQPVPSSPDQIVEDYLASLTIDIDRDEIRSLWRDMSNTLIKGCINGTSFHSVEQFFYHKILPGIYVAGTADAVRPTGNGFYTIRDYKSASIKPSSFPYHYRMQLHTYAYLLTKQGIPIDTVELCYVTRPTKTLPSRHFHMSEPFTSDDLAKIESQLFTIAKSIELWQSSPDLHWALAQDSRLMLPAQPKLFKA